MKPVVVFAALLALAACETGAPAAGRPQQHDTAQSSAPAKPGVKVSGSARAGVSHSF
ncbi:hypothetical protein RBY4I_2288 [Rhodobacterales bacterium Y4I]|nr:hypothetical protein RBY4I_2288 [Rhodobacterales bacterium Y4I]